GGGPRAGAGTGRRRRWGSLEKRNRWQPGQWRQGGKTAVQPRVKASPSTDQQDAQHETPATPSSPSGAPPPASPFGGTHRRRALRGGADAKSSADVRNTSSSDFGACVWGGGGCGSGSAGSGSAGSGSGASGGARCSGGDGSGGAPSGSACFGCVRNGRSATGL